MGLFPSGSALPYSIPNSASLNKPWANSEFPPEHTVRRGKPQDDRDGYTIIQDPQTGYYVYAIKTAEGDLAPSPFIAGRAVRSSRGKAHSACFIVLD
jgi:hypothetical protein